MAQATIKQLGIQAGTDRTVFVTWEWSKEQTKEFKVRWWYGTADGNGFIGTETTTAFRMSTYTPPENAVKVSVYVQPIANTHKVNGSDVVYWTADWSTQQTHYFKNDPPLKPPVPTVTMERYTLTAVLDNLGDLNGATSIQFQVVMDDKTVFKTSNSTITDSGKYVRYSCVVNPGYRYKVRARSCRDKLYSEWTDYTSNYETLPHTPEGFSQCRATTKTSVFLQWYDSASADTYDIQYTTKKKYFDFESAETKTITGIEGYRYEITGLETGQEYFFRYRSVNSAGASDWSKEYESIILGKKPIAPTTWSSSTTVIVGEELKLYWIHNSEDGSSQKNGKLEIIIGEEKRELVIPNSTDEDEKDKTSVYVVDTSLYSEGTKILWRVCTSGITDEYGDWSIQRTVDIYAPPTQVLSVTDVEGEPLSVLTQYPFYIACTVGPTTQTPIGYHVTIFPNMAYETVDHLGNAKFVNKGDEIYSHHYDTTNDLVLHLTPGSVDLVNNVEYTVKCIAAMSSGLTSEGSVTFTVGWTEVAYEPNAEIGIDPDTYTAVLRPYCEDSDGNIVPNLLLSVYRREFDGGFTEIMRDIPNDAHTFISDPHPALDYARYRIVATSEITGAIGYYDIPPYPVGGHAVIVQWDESWSNFDGDNADATEEPPWSGSLLKLPYNIDVSDSNQADVELVEYIGRAHPVTYYGTQLGATATWNVSIPKTDVDTLYALRRLSRWMGDVYVREPSGSGYWANVKVSFSQKHKDLTIPVTLDIVRVEGGM